MYMINTKDNFTEYYDLLKIMNELFKFCFDFCEIYTCIEYLVALYTFSDSFQILPI